MDKLRVFSTFKSSQGSFAGRSFHNDNRKERLKSLPRDKNGMVERSLSNKKSLSRDEILEKLNKAKAPELSRSKQVKGQRFGDGFMVDEKIVGDISKNDPRDPMTSEKLKSMLTTGVVNFSGKEQEILSKILNAK